MNVVRDPVAEFPWHQQQLSVLRAATDVISANGGNQSGKTMSGLGVVARLIRREGPIYARLRNPERRTMRVWVAPKTLEKYLSLWEPRIIDFVLAGMEVDRDYEYKQNPFPVFTKWREDGVADWIIQGKAQKQGFLAFESDAVDLIVLDEEPEDPRIISSSKARFSTTNGVLVLCFTPLLGMSFTYHQFYAPTVKPKHLIGERAWRLGNQITVVEMGMADNPESIAGGGVARMLADPSMGEAEKAARLYGKYGYTEGLLLPALSQVGATETDAYSIDALPAGRSFAWILAADPNKRHGALLAAIDYEGNRYYCQEHYAESLPDSKHAEAYRRMMAVWGVDAWVVDIWADPGGAGAQAIINLAECGIFAKAVPKDAGSVSASIKRLRGAAFIDPTHTHPITGKKGAPRTYFVRWNEATGRGLRSTWAMNHVGYAESRLCWELRQYRQDEGKPPDTPVKTQDDVVDCARYIELARSVVPAAPDDPFTARDRADLDPLSLEATDAFEEMARQAEERYLAVQTAARTRFEEERASIAARRRSA